MGILWRLITTSLPPFTTYESTLFASSVAPLALRTKMNIGDMVSGDALRIRIYTVNQSGGAFNVEYDTSYNGEQSIPVIDLPAVQSQWGVAVSTQLTSGSATGKTLECMWFQA